jgi:hypothetical protein
MNPDCALEEFGQSMCECNPLPLNYDIQVVLTDNTPHYCITNHTTHDKHALPALRRNLERRTDSMGYAYSAVCM